MLAHDLLRAAALACLGLLLSACTDTDPASDQTTTTASRVETRTGAAGEIGLIVDASNASITQGAGPGCLVCSVDNLDAILDGDPEKFGTAHLSLSVLGAGAESDLNLTVKLNQVVDPSVQLPLDPADANSNLVAANAPGFAVSFPDIELASLSLLPTIGIETLKDGEVVNDPQYYPFGIGEFLALGVLAVDINNAHVYLGTAADEAYDAIRLSMNGSALDLLINVNIHQVGLYGKSGSIEGDF